MVWSATFFSSAGARGARAAPAAFQVPMAPRSGQSLPGRQRRPVGLLRHSVGAGLAVRTGQPGSRRPVGPGRFQPPPCRGSRIDHRLRLQVGLESDRRSEDGRDRGCCIRRRSRRSTDFRALWCVRGAVAPAVAQQVEQFEYGAEFGVSGEAELLFRLMWSYHATTWKVRNVRSVGG